MDSYGLLWAFCTTQILFPEQLAFRVCGDCKILGTILSRTKTQTILTAYYCAVVYSIYSTKLYSDVLSVFLLPKVAV